ncbi:Ig-like domain-containing protein [Amnibacterium flavum]|uniref:Ig-like domain-containing protein n=1 Tax=Amnibacterium flavum TaxID=2173173 RepID=UPI00105785DB|nr:Ig-like domain-containing protein [Amnibacterium flavum]
MSGLPARGRSVLGMLARRRSVTITSVGVVAIAAVLVSTAVVSGGYTAQRMDLDDGSVWVANGSKQAIGRANEQILQLDTAVASTSSSIEVIRQGADVILFDRANSTIDLVDPAVAAIDDTVPVPPGGTEVYTTGPQVTSGVAVVHSGATGDAWVVPLEQLSAYDAQSEPDLVFGATSVSSMDSDGTFFVWSPDAGEVSRVEAADGAVVNQTYSIEGISPDDDFEITSVGGRWFLLDTTTRIVYSEGRSTDLSALIGVSGAPVLETPVTAADGGRGATDQVYIAHASGLVRVPTGGGEPEEIAERDPVRGPGTVTAPLVRGGCSYAAWPDGTVWTRCLDSIDSGSRAGTITPAAGMAATAQLAFATKGTRVLLNDVQSGASWAVQDGNALIDNWDELLETETDTRVVEDNTEDTPPEYDKLQAPPVAVADDLGARPGRTSVVPVLLNDYDPNGDVLVIDEVTGFPPSAGSVTLTGDRQQLLLTLADDPPGSFTFGYSISDGRGGEAATSVTITLRGDDENSAPVQSRTTKATVASGSRTTSQVLGDWYDPDGDAFFLRSASAAAPDSVTYKPDGEVVFIDAGGADGVKEISQTVSDGRDDGTGVLAVTVRARGEVPIIVEPFVVLAYTDGEVTISPLQHTRGGSAPIRLTNVPDKAGVRITADYEGGTFRAQSSDIGTHYLDFTVTDGAVTVTGTLRLDVEAPPDPGTAPIPVPHTAFIRQGGTETIDVVATDIDPAGGVLLVAGADEPDNASGLRVELLEQHLLRVTLTGPLESGTVSFGYTLSNGLAEAQGSVTVVEIPEPARLQPPIAVPDRVSVRVGDAIDIPVLLNDEQPDGESLTLDPVLVDELPDGAGLLFAAQNRLRYLAPQQTGDFTAVYRVDGPDGQWASAEVSISVREADTASNNPPVPKTVTSRVLAGESVRIPIPLTGIDPDGDSVQLLGQESNPEKGAVVETGSDWIEYEAGDYSAGTDSLIYRVVDGLGASATGTIRIGISPRLDGARNPVAVADEVTVRPGKSVAVQVLSNDSDPDGGQLDLVSIEPTTTGADAEIDGTVVRFTATDVPGRYGFVYSIENARGGTSSNFLTVVVDPEAPLARPIAEDTVLGLSDILGRTSIDVNVLAGVFFAEGSVRRLDLAVLPGFGDTATVTSSKRVRVELQDRSQIIPFRVSHPDDPSVTAFAFIRVPGFDDALPQLRKGTPRLTVVSGERLVIDVNDYVVAVGGKRVRITDSGSVRATHSDGSALVAGTGTLTYTSADQYFGPASISFEVTDGSSISDPNGRRATLVLPITVTPRDNQPPVFDGAVLELEPGAERSVDLVKITSYPYAADIGELAYSLVGSAPPGFQLSIDGSKLIVRADESTPKGTRASTIVGVRDSVNEGTAGRVQLTVVASTRPLANLAADAVVAPRGQTTTVDVLANDEAGNPFPGKPLSVVAVRGIDSAALPDGVSITPSSDRTRLAITVGATAAPQDVTVQYQALDATGDPDRAVWGSVTISVQDKPEPVTGLRPTGYADRAITVAFDPGSFNNSPITGFDVTTYDNSGRTLATTPCASTTCTVTTPGNGPSNRIRIGVVAKNAIGTSTQTMLGDAVWSDIVPAAPTDLVARSLDHGLRVSWRKPTETGGSPISYYLISVAGVSVTKYVGRGDPAGTEYSIDLQDPSVGNGGALQVTVSGRNDAFDVLSVWNSATTSGTPAGPPIVVGSPGATTVDGGATGTVTVGWSGVFDGNGAGISQYYVARYRGSPPTCSANGVGSANPSPVVPSPSDDFRHVGTATSADFQVGANEENLFVVFAYNGQGCTSSGQIAVTTRQAPGAPTSVGLSGPTSDGAGHYDYRLSGVAYASGGGNPSVRYLYRLDGGGAETPISIGDTIRVGYGVEHTIQVQVCESWPGKELCSGWSGDSAAFTPIDTVPAGLSSREENGETVWSWTSLPSGSYDSVEYICQPGDVWTASNGGAAGECRGSIGTPFRVRVTEAGQQYVFSS